MKNRNVGFLIAGIALVLMLIIFMFNQALKSIVSETCSHGPSCTMYTTISTQTYISLAITGFVLLIGIFFIFSKENEKLVIKRIKPLGDISPKKFNKESLKGLSIDEKRIMDLILNNKGSIYQSEIVSKLNLNKVKVTRLLDSLESQAFIERKRRGMTNIVMLTKHE
ncbi:MAG: MarR family transcriptional regulator [Candidatus Pacearchaeota archaeon]|jgi:uncharacterized membrane protein